MEPGVTRTSFEENLTRADQPLSVYESGRTRSENLMRKWVEEGDAPEIVADTVVTDRLLSATARRSFGNIPWKHPEG